MYFRIFCENTTKNKNLFIFLGVGVVSLAGIGFCSYKYCNNKKNLNNLEGEIGQIVNGTGKIDYKSKDVEKYFYHFIIEGIDFNHGVEKYTINGIDYKNNQKVNEIREFCKKISESRKISREFCKKINESRKTSSSFQVCEHYWNVIMKVIDKFDTGSDIFTVFKKINKIKLSDQDKIKLSQHFGNNEEFEKVFYKIIKEYGIMNNEIKSIDQKDLMYILIEIIKYTQLKTEYKKHKEN